MPEPGVLFTNRAIADTYTRVLRETETAGSDRVAQIERARKVWSQGFVAEAIDKFCRTQKTMDVSGERHVGVLTGADIAAWQAHIEPPLTYDYGRYTVCKTGVWSQGPVVLLQQLALLKGFDLDGLDPAGPDFVHLQVECAKLAYADRESFYGDPDFVRAPIETLLSDRYNADRRKLIGKQASLELRPGSVKGFGAAVEMRRAEGARAAVGAFGAGEPTVGRVGEVIGDTVHFDIVDTAGNMVSSTPSGGWLQSSPALGGGMRQAGILAAAGLVALDTLVARLADDHANARLLAEALRRGRGVQVCPVETNMVVAELEGRTAPDVVASLRTEGVLATAMDGRTLRVVTHHDVSSEDCARAAAAIERVLG